MRINKEKHTLMTDGSIAGHLIKFALPLLMGNIFQQLYNMVDTWVVGNYVSNEAFSAVGTVGPIVNMLIALFIGLSSGAGVVISQYYGAEQDDKVQDAVHTAIMMTVCLGVLMSIVGVALRNPLLRLMNIPDEVFGEASTYLGIFFSGMSALMFYNISASILQATGDSKRPFLFLMTATVLNIVLDLLFVLKFNMGVEGVAYATIIAMAVSALFGLGTLFTSKNEAIKLHIGKLRIDFPMLYKIFRIGIPAAIQSAVIAFSNIFVQGYINYFGADVMSGWTAYSKVDSLMLLPMQSISIALSTFVGQNIGVGKTDRAIKGVRIAILMAFVSTVVPMVPVMIFAPQLVGFFNSKPEVIMLGTMILRWISPFYALTCSSSMHASALRGAGNSTGPMVITMCSYVLFRQIYLFVMSHYISNTVIPIVLGYPAGWIVCATAMLIYYKKTDISTRRVVD